jgi:exodeoxyribonuclease VII large subunit
VLVVRGGASAGLGALTNVSIARAICQMPVPVITGLGHAHDQSILDEVAWRSADTPSKALQLVKSLMRRRAEAAYESYLASVNHIDRLLEQFFRPRLIAKETELRHAFEITFAKHRDQLRDTWFGVQGHLLSLRSELKYVAGSLDKEAQSLLTRAGALPQKIGREAHQLYAAIGQGAQTRYAVLAAKRPSIQTSAALAESLLARQAQDLERLFSLIEIAARRRLAKEGDRLGQKLQSLDALGIEGTLGRGFVLPLDANRHIVRSADTARAMASIELLFCDGTVACRPVSIA